MVLTYNKKTLLIDCKAENEFSEPLKPNPRIILDTKGHYGVNSIPVGSVGGERLDGMRCCVCLIGILLSSWNTLRYISWLIL